MEEPAPALVLSNFLMTEAVNLLSSLMGVKLTDLGVDLFLSAVLNVAGLLLIGVTILFLLKEIAAVDLTGVVVNLEVPLAGLLLIGVAMLSLLKEIAAVDLTGVEVK